MRFKAEICGQANPSVLSAFFSECLWFPYTLNYSLMWPSAIFGCLEAMWFLATELWKKQKKIQRLQLKSPSSLICQLSSTWPSHLSP